MSDDWPRIPHVGIGCIVLHAGRVLLVRNHEGLWSTPGGHLDFGESPAEAAARETVEETGVSVYGARPSGPFRATAEPATADGPVAGGITDR